MPRYLGLSLSLCLAACGSSEPTEEEAEVAPTPVDVSEQPTEASLRAACGAADRAACRALARRYLQATTDDPARGVALLAAGCEASDAASCTDLGEVYYDGTVVEQDHARALELVVPACDEDIPKACNLASWIWSTSSQIEERQPRQALAFARSALDHHPYSLAYRDTFAAALANIGRYQRAAAEQEAAILDTVVNQAVSEDYYLRLHAYRAGQPWRE